MSKIFFSQRILDSLTDENNQAQKNVITLLARQSVISNWSRPSASSDRGQVRTHQTRRQNKYEKVKAMHAEVYLDSLMLRSLPVDPGFIGRSRNSLTSYRITNCSPFVLDTLL
jgi:hypothetical protein